ncbi:sodium:alanine symporter family protein [Franconibacter daqui]|uniref:alanine/glycine:cation symporter family protein n=1 Tax=Franconibacter daqui TaxID=2047724 RepID=UPI0030CAAF64
MSDFLYFISDILWGSVMIYLLPGAGIWFTFRTGGIQFRYLRHFAKSLRRSITPATDGLTSFQALCTSLAARVSSGNIAGVAIAIATGGPGAVFWMWVTALVGMATSFAECSLAQLYKGRDASGRFRGGPAWYMERGLGMRWMGVLFSIFLLIAFGLVFNAVQANSLTLALNHAFNAPKWFIAVVLVAATLLVILRGMKGVARFSQWVMPITGGAWALTAAIVVLLNLPRLPDVVALIFKSAFGWHEAASGALAWTLSQAITSGFQRGMFSNEAGMGSTPNAAAAAASWPPHPAAQGIVQMIGVFIDTVIICSATAAIVLLSGAQEQTSASYDGIMLTQQALATLAGSWASGYVAIIVMFFAFTSIVANYAYAENNLLFLTRSTPLRLWLLRAGTLSMVLFGAFATFPTVWQLADIAMALLAITNLIAILLLSPVVKLIADDYLRQRKLGIKPVFDVRRYPDIERQLEADSWKDLPRE